MTLMIRLLHKPDWNLAPPRRAANPDAERGRDDGTGSSLGDQPSFG
jgi:hypothetical protein